MRPRRIAQQTVPSSRKVSLCGRWVASARFIRGSTRIDMALRYSSRPFIFASETPPGVTLWIAPCIRSRRPEQITVGFREADFASCWEPGTLERRHRLPRFVSAEAIVVLILNPTRTMSSSQDAVRIIASVG